MKIHNATIALYCTILLVQQKQQFLIYYMFRSRNRKLNNIIYRLDMRINSGTHLLHSFSSWGYDSACTLQERTSKPSGWLVCSGQQEMSSLLEQFWKDLSYDSFLSIFIKHLRILNFSVAVPTSNVARIVAGATSREKVTFALFNFWAGQCVKFLVIFISCETGYPTHSLERNTLFRKSKLIQLVFV